MRDNGSWLVDAMTEVREFEQQLPVSSSTHTPGGGYLAFAGCIVKQLGHLPVVGESLEVQGFCVEVIDMDKRRAERCC